MRAARIVVALRYDASATSARLCLQCLWGEVSSVYSLYARRAAAPFAAMDWYRCGKTYGELLSAASSRTRSTEYGFAKPSLASKPSRPPARGLVPSLFGPATSALL